MKETYRNVTATDGRMVGSIGALCFACTAATDWTVVEAAFAEVDQELRADLALAVSRLLVDIDPRAAAAAAWCLAPIARASSLAPPKPICPLRPSADMSARVKWLTAHVQPYTDFLGALVIFGEADHEHAVAEAQDAAIGCSWREGWPSVAGEHAARVAWPQAEVRARRIANALNRRLWPLGKSRAPGEEILAAAATVNVGYGVVVPTEVLIKVARRIAHGAASGRWGRG